MYHLRCVLWEVDWPEKKEGKKSEVCLVQIVTEIAIEERKGIVLTVPIRDTADNFCGSVKQGWNNEICRRKY